MDEGIVFWLFVAIASILSILIVLVPVIGLTARFALKPILESIAQFRDMQGERQTVELLERRVALIEEQMNSVDRSLQPLVEEAEFRRKLEAAPRQG